MMSYVSSAEPDRAAYSELTAISLVMQYGICVAFPL